MLAISYFISHGIFKKNANIVHGVTWHVYYYYCTVGRNVKTTTIVDNHIFGEKRIYFVFIIFYNNMVVGQKQQKTRSTAAKFRLPPLFERFGVFRFSYCCTPRAQF